MMREQDEPDAAFQGSDPGATNSTAAAPRDDGELYPQADISAPWARSTGVPPLPAVPVGGPQLRPRQRGRRCRRRSDGRCRRDPAKATGKAAGTVRPARARRRPRCVRRRYLAWNRPATSRKQEFADLNAKWRRLQGAKRIRRPGRPSFGFHRRPTIRTTRSRPGPDNWEDSGGIRSCYAAYPRRGRAKQHSPELLARLFIRSSNTAKTAVSPAIALALLSSPGAVKSVGRNPHTFNYYDPQTSIDAGAAYLAQQYRQLKNWPKAVAAYNLGSNGLQRWLEGDGDDRPHARQQSTLHGGGR